jgi:hypothetical protein
MSATLGKPPFDKTSEFKKNQILSILLSGNRYAEIKRNKKGEIIELIPISTERVTKDHNQVACRIALSSVTSMPDDVVEVPTHGKSVSVIRKFLTAVFNLFNITEMLE